MDQKARILEFVQAETLAVMTTVSADGKPQAALVGFTEGDDLTLIVGTSNLSRKYKNIQHEPHVALVIGWSEGMTVQFEGVAEELVGEEAEKAMRLHIKKHPFAEKYARAPDERFFRISPLWVRYTDYKSKPEEVFEVTFA